MATVDITTEQFEQTIEGSDIVLVDFWADWCGPCKAFAPVYESVSEENPDVVFAKVDTVAEEVLAAQAGIRSIPTLMAFRDQVLVFSQPGALPKQQLTSLVDAVRGLDMDKVHAEIAERKEAGQQG